MEAARLKRQLTAILLADVVGYSRLMGSDEEGTHARLAECVDTLIEPKIVEYGGRPVRSMGDAILAQFSSAIDAVRCAIDIQRNLARREAGGAPERQIQLRIGINSGDVIVDERDIYGNSINIAARLEGLAGPGEIFVTQGVYEQLRGYPELRFSDRGERRLKNIDHPVRVFRVEHDEGKRAHPLLEGIATRWRLFRYLLQRRPRSAGTLIVLSMLAALSIAAVPGWRYSAVPARASILVLPFKNLSNGANQEYLADAVTNDLTTDLSRLRDVGCARHISGHRLHAKGKAHRY